MGDTSGHRPESAIQAGVDTGPLAASLKYSQQATLKEIERNRHGAGPCQARRWRSRAYIRRWKKDILQPSAASGCQRRAWPPNHWLQADFRIGISHLWRR